MYKITLKSNPSLDPAFKDLSNCVIGEVIWISPTNKGMSMQVKIESINHINKEATVSYYETN